VVEQPGTACPGAVQFTFGESVVAVPHEPLSVPVPMLTPTVPVVLSQVAVLPVACEHRKNVTFPLGVFEGWLPMMVAVSWTATPGLVDVALGVVDKVACIVRIGRRRSP
jgi:hypothetical protein